MHDVAAIILAAGHSRRMGASNKLLLPIDGTPMIRHVVDTYRAAIDGPITVVTGFEASHVERALADVDVTCVFNANHADGQPTSVACGLTHAPEAELLLIGLGDQPLLTVPDIQDLLDAHRRAAPDKISIPATGDTRGNPIVIPHALRARLTENPSRPGCMGFTRDNPDLVQRHALTAKGFYADIDTPDDYAALTQPREDAL